MKKIAGIFVLPVACWLLSGCSGGGSGGNNGSGSSGGNVSAGQVALNDAIAGFDTSGKVTPQTKALLQQAINQFNGPAARGDSTANAGLATALFAQATIEISEDPNLKALAGSALPLGDGNTLGFQEAASARLKNSKKGLLQSVASPVSLISTALPSVSKKSGAKTSARPRIAANEIRNLQTRIANVELPRLIRITAALQKINKTPSYGFVVYKKGTTNYKLYGPDFQMVQGFAEAGVGLFSTLVAYDLDPGTLYQNIDDERDLDANKDGKLTPNEYLGSGNFLKLRADGATRLTTALTFFRRAADTLGTGIQAEKTFNAPADALVKLTSDDRDKLGKAATVVTQVKTALNGNYSFPFNDKDYTVNVSQFFQTPISDFRTALPTLNYRYDEDEEEIDYTGYTLPADRTFSGVFPIASERLYEALLEELENADIDDDTDFGMGVILAKR